MSEQAILNMTLVLSIAAFLVSLWALAAGLVRAERLRDTSKSNQVERIRRYIARDKAALSAAEELMQAARGSRQGQNAYQAAALALAEDYEELCELLARNRQDADNELMRLYGDEIQAWVEDGPLNGKYRRRVPCYPATAKIWRLTRASDTHGRAA